jgi:AcrR family transcriptional regulator
VSASANYHHGNLRRALMDAAIRLVAERGSLDFTMRELARAAGVTHNAPYRHFDDREALLAALAEEGFVRLKARCLADRPDLAAGPRAAICALGRAYVEFAVEASHIFRLMFGETTARSRAGRPALARAARASFAVLEEAIAACRSNGTLRADLDPREATLAAWSLVHGFASLLVAGQVPPSWATGAARARHIEALAGVFLDGALTAAPPRA